MPNGVRVRFGLRLQTPFGIGKNAGTFVTYLDEKQYKEAVDAVLLVKKRLNDIGNSSLVEFASRLFIERS